MKICVLMPSFNEEKTVGVLVAAVKRLGFDVLVVDDGSKDGTAGQARESGADILVNDKNLGKGAALRRGFTALAERPYDAVVVMDADGQHLPKDLRGFVDLYSKDRPGVIVGNRMANPKGMPWIRRLTNAVMSTLISWKCGQHIPDTQCGFRLIDVALLKKMRLATDNFEIESEILLEAAENGFKIASVSVATVYEGQTSAIHPVKDTARFFRFILSRRRR